MNTMKLYIRENNWLPRRKSIDFEWGNGYVIIPSYFTMVTKELIEKINNMTKKDEKK